MRLKVVGMIPNCAAIKAEHEDFIGEYHPSCCRWPKSCSPNMVEFYPENEVEVPKKFRISRTPGIEVGNDFSWMLYGYHPTAQSSTITLLKYFSTFEDANAFLKLGITWKILLKYEGVAE